MPNPWKLTSLVLAAALAASLVSSAAADRQPRMQAALRSLESARGQLQAASADKGGHRVKAIGYVDQAIAEVKAGIAFDNAN